MNIVLIGYRGCGKSTVGRKLADRLWRGFVDVDDFIVKKAGKSIAEIFAQDGERHFRALESECLHELLLVDDQVIALGGGTVIEEANCRLLKEADVRIIYLRCEPAELHRRINADPQSAVTRPALTDLGGGLAEIELKLAEREPIYRQVMHAELDVTHLSADDAMVYVVRLL